ncbi:hypothetical protein C8J57DRAFT_1566057 [Mycena rebaudengoi]|nr:hypothetical protein C8J57DRAFT_1566057 [Mycena rebaudengoi]
MQTFYDSVVVPPSTTFKVQLQVFDAVYNDARASTAMLVALFIHHRRHRFQGSRTPSSIRVCTSRTLIIQSPVTQALKHSNPPRPNLHNASSFLKTSTLQELAEDESHLCLCYLDGPSLQSQCLFSMVHTASKNSAQSFYSRQVLVKRATSMPQIIPFKFLRSLAERFKIYCTNSSYNIPPSTSSESCQRALDSKIEPRNEELMDKFLEGIKIKAPTTDKDGTFWKMYKILADEQDKEFHNKYGTDLDTSLIFAGLFSAVSSAFIIQIQPQLHSRIW